MKHNVFDEKEDTLQHSAEKFGEVLADAKANGTLKEAMIQHSITNIEVLFPEAQITADSPRVIVDPSTAYDVIVSGAHKSPFSRIKSITADLTTEEARAKGYIKGKEKLEQIFKLSHRETVPATIYKKQKLDRDDVIDITDIDVVKLINDEMRVKLNEELGKAILVGDGRDASSPDKINTEKIRPIVSDDNFYALKMDAAGVESIIETVITMMADYQGTGTPTLFIDPHMLAKLKLLKGLDGHFLFGNELPSEQALASTLGVSKIQPTTFLNNQIVIVNMADYTIGSTKGGEVTTFDDFDIDFNQYKYLIETRVSGALTVPKSAIVITVKTGTPSALDVNVVNAKEFPGGTPAADSTKTQGK